MEQAMKVIFMVVGLLLAMSLCTVFLAIFRKEIALLAGFIPWWIGKQWWPKVPQFFEYALYKCRCIFHKITCPDCWEWRLDRLYKFFGRVCFDIAVWILSVAFTIADFFEGVYWRIDLAIANAIGAVLWWVKNAIHSINHAVSKFEEWLWEVMQYCDEIDRGLR